MKKKKENIETQQPAEIKTFDNSSDIYLGRRSEDDNPRSDWGKIKTKYYFQNSSTWETKLLNYASMFFNIGDKVWVVKNIGSERVETESLIFHRSSTQFLVDVKGDDGEKKINIKDHDAFRIILSKYKHKGVHSVVKKSIFDEARRNYNFGADNTGYLYVPFNSNAENMEFVSAIKKIARRNKDILNVYYQELPAIDKNYIVKIYCLEKNKKNIVNILKELGVKGEVQFQLSKRAVVCNRKMQKIKIK